MRTDSICIEGKMLYSGSAVKICMRHVLIDLSKTAHCHYWHHRFSIPVSCSWLICCRKSSVSV